jgi:dTDP-4-amino-4,6-dideoxygalactose transaminase
MIGWNARMDGIQAAVLSVKLKYLPSWNEARRRIARLYSELLSGLDDVVVPRQADYARHVYHIYAIRVKNRDFIINGLSKRGIHCAVHYPMPIHLQDPYSSLRARESSLLIAEKCAEEYLSLPIFPELTENQIEYVVNELERLIT